jgi:hypothetical protein
MRSGATHFSKDEPFQIRGDGLSHIGLSHVMMRVEQNRDAAANGQRGCSQ